MNEELKAVHDPEEQKKLRELSNEITALLVKHDVCGYLLLHDKNTADYRLHIEASWSCLRFEPHPDGGMVARFKAAMKTGGPEEKERANWTFGMLLSALDQLSESQRMIALMVSRFSQAVGGIDHVSERNPEPAGK